MSILDLINAARATNGLAPLRPNSQLADAATRHARDIARNPIMTEDPARYHVGSDGSTILSRITASGYRPVNWREVTGWGWGGDEARQMDYWIGSMTHRAIILFDQVDEAGVGYVYDPGSKWGHYWVVDFGRRAGGVEPPPSLPYSSHIPIVEQTAVGRHKPDGLFILSTALAADAVAVTVEAVGIGREHLEAAEGDVAAVEIGWRGRDADGRIGRVAVAGRRRGAGRCGRRERGRGWRRWG